MAFLEGASASYEVKADVQCWQQSHKYDIQSLVSVSWTWL